MSSLNVLYCCNNFPVFCNKTIDSAGSLSFTVYLMGKAKGGSIFIRLVSAAGTGFFYVKRKNPRKMTEKLEFRKFDPRVNRHVLFTEAKMK
ncbi:50S ribosomal protein L33 [Thalictrum thalictroides]|uniref:Large ribosomal subunit protein bL33c n=3 Tax=Ranunculales TaxID=41768 RepID=A0A7J6X2N1_THATH|nr:50S ribosomal protein L33 [Thalictrum thalictroides]